MGRPRKPLAWIPLWIDAWLNGSVASELTLAEQAVFIRLLLYSGRDSGYLRENDGIPLSRIRLSRKVDVPISTLNRTIKKCLKFDKITKLEDGTLYVTHYTKYALNSDYIRRLQRESGDSTQEFSDPKSEKKGEFSDPIEDDTITKKKRRKKAHTQISEVQKKQVNAVVALWNKICTNLPKVMTVGAQRESNILNRVSEHPHTKEWQQVFSWLNESPHHRGDNERGWVATIDFIIERGKGAKFNEVLEKARFKAKQPPDSQQFNSRDSRELPELEIDEDGMPVWNCRGGG